MITIPSGARVLLATRPVDFRRGAHSLAALASEMLGADPFSGVVIVWRCLVLIWKQLQHGVFRWPPVVDGAMRLSAVEFAALFDGLDWTRIQSVRRIPTPTVAA